MDIDSQIAQVLHDEHLRIMDLMKRLEGVARGGWVNQVPDAADDDIALLLSDLVTELAEATEHHFQFEEAKIFPALIAVGDVTVPYLLRQEHDLLRNLSEFMMPHVELARRQGFTADTWAEFRDLSLELAEKHLSHIQREEAAMLPALTGLFMEQRDDELATQYAEA